MKGRTHDDAVVEQFRADPDYAPMLLIEVRRSCDSAELAILLRQITKAFGQDMGWILVDRERKLSST